MAHSRIPSPSGSDHYDPNQPRVAAGQPGGGRWTSLGVLLGGNSDIGGDESFREVQSNSSKLPPDSVQLAFSGLRSETNVPLPAARVAPNTFKLPNFQADRATEIYDLLSAQNGPGSQAVLTLHLREPVRSFAFWRSSPSEQFVFSHATVQRLTREEAQKACPRLKEVEDLLDKTFEDVLANNPNFDRGQIGSRMHRDMKTAVDDQGWPNVRGEVSYQEGEREPDRGDNSNYGMRGTIRPDLREIVMGGAVHRLSPKRACFVEYTIGQKYMGPGRAFRIGEMTRAAFPEVTEIVVTGIRPKGWRPGR